MKSFEERRDEVFARAGQMERKRKTRMRATVAAILLVSLLAVAAVGVAAAQRRGNADEQTGIVGTTPDDGHDVKDTMGFLSGIGNEPDLLPFLFKNGKYGSKTESVDYKLRDILCDVPKTVVITRSRERATVSYPDREALFQALSDKIDDCFSSRPEDRGAGFPEGGSKQVDEDVAFFHLIYVNIDESVYLLHTYALWGNKLRDSATGRTVVLQEEDRNFFEALITKEPTEN